MFKNNNKIKRRRHILNGLFQKKFNCSNYMFLFTYVNVGWTFKVAKLNIFHPLFYLSSVLEFYAFISFIYSILISEFHTIDNECVLC